MTKFVIFCIAGRVILFVLQKASKFYLPLVHKEKFRGFLEELVSCDLCFGVWLYSLGAWFLDINMLYEYVYIPVASEIVTGMITSFLVWLIVEGWKGKFQIVWVNQQE